MYTCEDLYKEVFKSFIDKYYEPAMKDIETKIRDKKFHGDLDNTFVTVPITVKEDFFVFRLAQKIIDGLKEAGYRVNIHSRDNSNNTVSLYIDWIILGRNSITDEINNYLEYSDFEDHSKENLHD